eukprot:10305800-Lingulodinium_polyedra.AAC.1
MRQSFASAGSFWAKEGIPKRWKRCMLICEVQNAMLTCLEPFLLSESQYDRMDRAIAGCARTAMQGAACKKEELGGGEMKYRSMDTVQ